MDFIKNLFSHIQSVDTENGGRIPEELSQNFSNENLDQDINIQDLMTSQSSDDISDLFTTESSNEVSNSPTNTEKSEHTINLKDIQEFTEDGNCKSVAVSNENLSSICTDDISAKNIDIEEIVLNLDEFEASFNEVNRDSVNECDENYKFKENNVTDETVINLDDFEEFLDNFDETDIVCDEIDEVVTSHNNIENTSKTNVKPLNVVDQNTEICFDEFENIFKSYDNINNSEKVHTIDYSASSLKTETIENTYVTEVPEFNETEMKHDFKNIIEDINILTEEFKHDNTIETIPLLIEIDFEENLKSNVISKLDPMVVIESKNQPMISKDVNSNLSNIENNRHEHVNELENDKNSVISISDTNSELSYIENSTSYEDLNVKSDKTVSSKTTNSPKPMDTLISSAGNEKIDDSDYCSGYNSSDFEFISEEDAQDGLIINCCDKKLDTPKKSSTVHTLEISKDKSYISGSSDESIEIENAGPRNRNYQNVHYIPVNTNYRQNHRIPENDEYLNLFQGIQVSNLFFLENKSIRPSNCMSTQFRDIGFDRVGVRKEDSEDGYNDEADESAKKILSMYPGENRKRRRRF